MASLEREDGRDGRDDDVVVVRVELMLLRLLTSRHWNGRIATRFLGEYAETEKKQDWRDRTSSSIGVCWQWRMTQNRLVMVSLRRYYTG